MYRRLRFSPLILNSLSEWRAGRKQSEVDRDGKLCWCGWTRIGDAALFTVGDAIELVTPMRAYGLNEGEVGTVVGIHRDNRTYIVAFVREGAALGTFDVPYNQLRHREQHPTSPDA